MDKAKEQFLKVKALSWPNFSLGLVLSQNSKLWRLALAPL
jgi:hypothetical protein